MLYRLPILLNVLFAFDFLFNYYVARKKTNESSPKSQLETLSFCSHRDGLADIKRGHAESYQTPLNTFKSSYFTRHATDNINYVLNYVHAVQILSLYSGDSRPFHRIKIKGLKWLLFFINTRQTIGLPSASSVIRHRVYFQFCVSEEFFLIASLTWSMIARRLTNQPITQTWLQYQHDHSNHAYRPLSLSLSCEHTW